MRNPYQAVFEGQRARFHTDVTKSRAWRLDQLDRMERLLTAHAAELSGALHQDFGKPPFEKLFEITMPSGVIKYYRENLHALMAPQAVPIPQGLEATGNRGSILKEPYGVTLVIGPFHAPVLLLLDPAIAALAAGNTVILKPANTTPATPVLPVLRYADLRATVDILKRRPKALATYIFSKDQQTIDRVLGSLSFGGGCVNQTNLHCWIDSLPFGGVGASGMGKYYGKVGFDALSNTKAMLTGNPDVELDVFPPYVGKDITKNLGVFSQVADGRIIRMRRMVRTAQP